MGTRKLGALSQSTKRKKAKPVSALFTTLLDTTKSPMERVAVLAELDNVALLDSKNFSSILDLLRNVETTPQLRYAILAVLKSAAFDTATFAPFKSQYVSALRSLRHDADPEIRQQAFGILARIKDPDTQAMLIEGLQAPTNALLLPEKALQLLSYDPHSGSFEVARQIAKDTTSTAAKREALRVLAADTQSVDMFENIFRNKQELVDIRQLAGSALNQLAPKRMQACARDAAIDESESDDIKTMSLTALTHFGDAQVLEQDKLLQNQIDNFQSPERSDALRNAARTFARRYYER